MEKNGSWRICKIFKYIKIIKTEALYKQAYNKKQAPSLGDMYDELFDDHMIGAHNAMVDVEYTSKCYVKLKKRIMTKKNISEDELIRIYSEKIDFFLPENYKIVKKIKNTDSEKSAQTDNIFNTIIKSAKTVKVTKRNK